MGKRGWRRHEPAPLPPEEPHRYKVLLFQAVMEGMITRGTGIRSCFPRYLGYWGSGSQGFKGKSEEPENAYGV
jgi:hypothetical protein